MYTQCLNCELQKYFAYYLDKFHASRKTDSPLLILYRPEKLLYNEVPFHMGFSPQESKVREGLRNYFATVLKFGLTYQTFFSLSAPKHQTCAHIKQSSSMATIPATHMTVFYVSGHSLWLP
jgi:hypothetical protein